MNISSLLHYVHVHSYHGHGHGRPMTASEMVAMLIVLNAMALVALMYWRVSAGSIKGMKDYFGWNPPALVMIAIGIAGVSDFIVLLMVAIGVVAQWIN